MNTASGSGNDYTGINHVDTSTTEVIWIQKGEMYMALYPIKVLLDKNRKNNPKDKKTDWFYQNEEFDRKLDDRADKNNYRTL